MVINGVVEKYNVSFVGGQLDRTVLEISEERVKEYIRKKFPKREIKKIQKYNNTEELF